MFQNFALCKLDPQYINLIGVDAYDCGYLLRESGLY